jgi:type II secretion system protein J
VRPRSQHAYFSASGFTLLEVLVAMALVSVLVGGITLTISTSLRVWERSRELAELNQEARAIMEMMTRDLRGAYLGLYRQSGYFLAQSGTDEATLEFTTENAAMARTALRPEAELVLTEESTETPTSDFVAVRYRLIGGELTRMSLLAPKEAWLTETPETAGAALEDILSDSVAEMQLRFYDGAEWVTGWETAEEDRQLPRGVSIEFVLVDERGNEHSYQSMVSLAAS